MPPGASLLLIGSGLYWILSSQLISSFTVLAPELIQTIPLGQVLVVVVGIVCLIAGLWTVHNDLEIFRKLGNGPGGYVYVLPIAFAALDLFSTVVSLSMNSGTVELNPFVSAAIQNGFVAMAPYFVSYLALSQGLAILMLRIGARLFGETSSQRVLPYTLICGISSFGPISNLLGLMLGYEALPVYAAAGLGSAVLATLIYGPLRTTTALRPHVLS